MLEVHDSDVSCLTRIFCLLGLISKHISLVGGYPMQPLVSTTFIFIFGGLDNDEFSD